MATEPRPVLPFPLGEVGVEGEGEGGERDGQDGALAPPQSNLTIAP